MLRSPPVAPQRIEFSQAIRLGGTEGWHVTIEHWTRAEVKSAPIVRAWKPVELSEAGFVRSRYYADVVNSRPMARSCRRLRRRAGSRRISSSPRSFRPA